MLKKFSALILSLLSTNALAQNVNPEPGDVWTYNGPTLGSGWSPLSSGQIPPPAPGLGGVFSLTPAVSGQFLNSLDTTGTFTRSQALIPSNNLSDITIPATARGNLSAMARDASDSTIPQATNNLLANTTAHIYFAKAYGACTWATDGTGDNSACILTAIAAAKADLTTDPTTFFRVGSGEVILPSSNIGISTTILQVGSPAVVIRGAGGPGAYGYCKTQLKWNGAAGDTMVQFGDDLTGQTVGGGLDGVCLIGNTVGVGTGAGVGLKIRSGQYANYNDFLVSNVQTAGVDVDVSAIDTNGSSYNNFTNSSVGLSSAGAINAVGFKIGTGTATRDFFANTVENFVIQHQNGAGILCGNSDTNFFRNTWTQPILGGTGIGLHLQGGASVAHACRENWFSGSFGSVTADDSVAPSKSNYVQVMNRESGTPLPTIVGTATLGYDTSDGIHFDNRVAATTFTQGGMVYKATPGTTGAVFDINTANASNFATAAKFGPSLPVYLLYASPNIGFNAYWKGGGNFAYGKGSSSNYGGLLSYGASDGMFSFSGATATGNADATLTTTRFWAVDRFGHERVSALAAPALTSCGTAPTISGDDRAGEITMGTGTPTGCVITFTNAYVAAPYCTVTWQATPLASQSYAVSATAITLTQTATSSNKVNYMCKARTGG